MKRKLFFLIIFSFIGGIVITLISGNFHYPDDAVIGAEKWGFPFYWLSQAIYPGSEKVIHWSNLLVDIIIWGFSIFILIYLIDVILTKFNHKKSNKKF